MPIIHPPGVTTLPPSAKPPPRGGTPANNSLPVQEKAATTSAPQVPRPAPTVPTTVPLATLLKTLGLPNDKLSATILSFAKFFSLPLEPAMLASVRQQVGKGLPGSPRHPASPAPATLTQTMQPVADSREALVLAALATADKGVKLSEKALAEYVDAIDPDRDEGTDQGDTGWQQGKEKNQQGKDQPDTEQSPLLNILNRLPGKDGRRWLVFPFSFSEGGAEYRASLRLLLDAAGTGKMSLDIAKSGATAQRWLFVVDSGKPQNHPGFDQVQVYLTPERSALEQQNLAKAVAQFLEVPPERVSVRGGTFPFAPDYRADEFIPVDEAV